MLLRILLAALLVMATVSVVFQFQNQRLLRDLLAEVRSHPVPRTAASASSPPAPESPPLLVPEPINPAAPLNPTPREEANAAPVETPADPQPDPPHDGRDETIPGTPDPPSEADASEMRQEQQRVVRGIVENLLAGRYGPVVDRFDAVMTDYLDRDGLAAAMDPFRSEHGPLKEITRLRPVTEGLPEDMNAFRVTAELADGHQLRFTITLDSQHRISGLMMQ